MPSLAQGPTVAMALPLSPGHMGMAQKPSVKRFKLWLINALFRGGDYLINWLKHGVSCGPVYVKPTQENE